MSLWARFDRLYIPEPNSGCWIWIGPSVGNGYGAFCGTYAHRVAWELAYDRTPEGLFVCHKCDAPPCVNPRHLFLGTAKDNQGDSVAKGRKRSAPSPGEKHWKAKLSEKQVWEIRASNKTLSELGKIYGVHLATIGKVKRYKLWTHI